MDTIRHCDTCGRRVYVDGQIEPYYRHDHGSVFCMTTIATVDGRTTPNSP